MLNVTRRDGETVRIRQSAMVAGKVVPRAPARRRGIPAAGARELMRVAARGWPAVETEQLGEWTLRASAPGRAPEAGAERDSAEAHESARAGGSTAAHDPTGSRDPTGDRGSEDVPPLGDLALPEKTGACEQDQRREHAPEGRRTGFTARANSVLPLGSPGMPLSNAIDRVERWYDARGLVPRLQVTTGGADTDEMLTAELERRGWRGERRALMRVAALAPLADREPDRRVTLSRTPDAAWMSLYGRVRAEVYETARKVLTGGPSVWFATVLPESGASGAGERGREEAIAQRRPLAIGRCAIDGRWAGFSAIEVAPASRRTGLATSVMAELARRALSEGASAAYLQVGVENEGARGLYDGMGFVDHHAYHYRHAPRD